jgi:dihydrofolate reductase
MRKLVSYMFTSIDGFIADADGGLDWVPIDDDLMRFANAYFRTFDGIVFSRGIYEGFVDYWDVLDPAAASPLEVEFAEIFRDMTRIVVSRTIDGLDDGRAILIRDRVPDAIGRLKREPGRDLLLICGPELRSTLARDDLVDLHRVLVAPVALGAGRRLFDPLEEPLGLRLVRARRFGARVEMLDYEPSRERAPR